MGTNPNNNWALALMGSFRAKAQLLLCLIPTLKRGVSEWGFSETRSLRLGWVTELKRFHRS